MMLTPGDTGRYILIFIILKAKITLFSAFLTFYVFFVFIYLKYIYILFLAICEY